MALDIKLAHGLAEHRARDRHGPFPERVSVFLARHDASVHLEVGHGEVVGEDSGRRRDGSEEQHVPDLPLGEGVDIAVDEIVVAGREDVYLSDALDAEVRQNALDVERRLAAYLLERAYVEALQRVAPVLARLLVARELGLDGDHVVADAPGACVVEAREPHDFEDVVAICVENAEDVVVVHKIIVAVAESEASFSEMNDVYVGIARISAHGKIDERIVDAQGEPCHCLRQVFARCPLDALNHGLDRGTALTVAAVHVHGLRIEVGDLLRDRAPYLRVRVFGKTLEDSPCVLASLVVKELEYTIRRLFGFERMAFLPSAGCISVEILPGVGRGVEIVKIDSVFHTHNK